MPQEAGTFTALYMDHSLSPQPQWGFDWEDLSSELQLAAHLRISENPTNHN